MSVILQFSQSSAGQIPYTMNKSLHRQTRSFGRNVKNNMTQNQIEVQLSLKPRNRKKPLIIVTQRSSSLHPQMQYFDDIMKYVLNNITYAQISNKKSKPKNKVQTSPNQTQSINLINHHLSFLTQKPQKPIYFKNPQLTLQKRSTLIDWIISIHKRYKLREQTLFMCVYLIDKYCQYNHIQLNKYQLVGVAALFMAAKYQQIVMPLFKDYYKLVDDQYEKEEILDMESQVLKYFGFEIGKKVTQLWYLQAFGNQQVIFGKPARHTRRVFLRDKSSQNKQNNCQFHSQTIILQNKNPLSTSEHFSKFMKFSRYILNLILLDYNMLSSYHQDVIAISSLVFSSFKRQFSDADSKKLLNYCISHKMGYINDEIKQKQMKKQVKKCVQKIEWLYEKRFENKFYNVNQKFDVDIRY